jgi:hypothetical protein
MKDGFDKFNVGNKVSLTVVLSNVGNKVSLTVVLSPTTNTPEPIVLHRNLLSEIERRTSKIQWQIYHRRKQAGGMTRKSGD